MPKKYKAFTDHTSENMWAKVALAYSGRIARGSVELSVHMRLFLLGLGRVSNRGHAHFPQGELTKQIQKTDGTSYVDKQIRNEIARLVSNGLLAPVSNIRCLVYPRELIVLTTEKKNAAVCPEHGTHSSWSIYNKDWVPDYPPVGVVTQPIIPDEKPVEEIYDEFEEFYLRVEGTHGS